MKKYLLFLIILFFTGCSKNPTSPTIFNVEYKVTGTAHKVDVTYANQNEDTAQESNVNVPWSYSFKGNPGNFVYISAQNQDSTGSVIVTIYKDGSVFKTTNK